MIIEHNMAAINANCALKNTGKSLRTATEKLSSGYRINCAGDDAAGLGISEKMRAQIRGLNQATDNVEDGIALCKMADGELSEVNDMIHRVRELAVQAANETNTTDDREKIQLEIDQIVREIDRIGNTAEFNTIKVFKGDYGEVKKVVKNDIDWSKVSVSDLTLTFPSLGHIPFDEYSNGNILNLRAIYKGATSGFAADGMRLIYESGDTSNTQINIKYKDEQGTEQMINCDLATENPTNYRFEDNKWSRDFRITNGEHGIDVTITQTIKTDESRDTEKYYLFDYSVKNNSGKNIDFSMEFYADTSYGGDDAGDYEETYYIDGNPVERCSVYSTSTSSFAESVHSSFNYRDGVPDSFSIINTERALPFSEKICFTDEGKPDSVSIEHWGNGYASIAALRRLGYGTEGSDMAFRLYWENTISDNSTKHYKFNYGIMASEIDPNLTGVPIKKSSSTTERMDYYKKMWVQSGANGGQGMWLKIGELSSHKLKIDHLDVTTTNGAVAAIDAAAAASQQIVDKRSLIGAQQNRLEHAVCNDMNASENLQAAESRIRDANMADEMTKYAKYNILQQSGQSMLAQAQKMPQGILSLLQG